MSELLEKILSKDNINTAYRRVCTNKGVGGVDDVAVEGLGDYIKENWESIREQIRRKGYKPGLSTMPSLASERTALYSLWARIGS